MILVFYLSFETAIAYIIAYGRWTACPSNRSNARRRFCNLFPITSMESIYLLPPVCLQQNIPNEIVIVSSTQSIQCARECYEPSRRVNWQSSRRKRNLAWSRNINELGMLRMRCQPSIQSKEITIKIGIPDFNRIVFFAVLIEMCPSRCTAWTTPFEKIKLLHVVHAHIDIHFRYNFPFCSL